MSGIDESIFSKSRNIFLFLNSQFQFLLYFPKYEFEHNSPDINKKGELRIEK